MDLISSVLIGFALAMDSVAVSLVGGLTAQNRTQTMLPTALSYAGTFAVFQGVMTVIGYFAGAVFAERLAAVDHWIAFGLLTLIGGHMIFNTFKEEDDADGEPETEPVGYRGLFLAGLATSIDALAVGVGLSLLATSIWIPALAIAGVTFVLCIPAVLLGSRLGNSFSKRAEFLGGAILIAIGGQILLDHLFL